MNKARLLLGSRFVYNVKHNRLCRLCFNEENAKHFSSLIEVVWGMIRQGKCEAFFESDEG